MEKIEICRIVFGFDSKQEANRWWEAKLVTSQGEQTIYREEYWDELFRSDVGGMLSVMTMSMSDSKYKDEQNKSKERMNSMHAKLIARLIQDGWEPMSSDSDGRIIMLKRMQSQ
jgi:hypothetical protein